MRDENQLHAAIVEIVANERAEVKYSTVQNWYPGDAEGKFIILLCKFRKALYRDASHADHLFFFRGCPGVGCIHFDSL